MNSLSVSDFDFLKSSLLREDKLMQKFQETPIEEIVGLFIKRKKHFEVHKDYIAEIKQDPESGLSEKEDIQFCAAYVAIQKIVGYRVLERELANIAGTNPKLTLIQEQILKMFFDLCQSPAKNLINLLHGKNIFLGLLLKDNSQQYLSQIGTLCRQDPVYAVSLGYFSLEKLEKYPGFQRTIATRMDNWLAQQLSVTNFKKANSASPDFEKLILGYLGFSSAEDSAAADVIFKKCDAFSTEMQSKMWKIFDCNSSIDKKRLVIHDFIATDHNAEANKLFYTYFTSLLNPQQQSEILGGASDQQQQRYARLLKGLNISLTDIKIKLPQDKTAGYLIWNLLKSQKMTQSEIITLIDGAELPDTKTSTSNSFLFQEKDRFYSDIFVAGCRKMKGSHFLSLRWLASFRNCPESASGIAARWTELPETFRQDENIILSLDNHFDLVYQAALRGDTGIINEVKVRLNKEDFKKRLMRPHNGKDTVLHALCRQSKKGILKVLDSFSELERKELLQIKNDMEQTPIDCCSSDFYRYLTQGNFIRPVQPKVKEEKSSEEKPVVPVVKEKAKTVAQIWRPVVRVPNFEKDMKELSLNSEVIDAAKRKIRELRTMSDIDLRLQMRQDTKTTIKNKPCVADFSVGGKAYRMGYIVQKGVLAPFFLMNHGHYDNELKNTRYMPLLMKLARRLAEDYQRS